MYYNNWTFEFIRQTHKNLGHKYSYRMSYDIVILSVLINTNKLKKY